MFGIFKKKKTAIEIEGIIPSLANDDTVLQEDILICEDETLDNDPTSPELEAISEPEQDAQPLVYDPKQEASTYMLPPLELLAAAGEEYDDELLKAKAASLVELLLSCNIQIQEITINPGVSKTLFEVKPGSGAKMQQIIKLREDIALAMSAKEVVIMPIVEHGTVGVSIPNDTLHTLPLRLCLQTLSFLDSKAELPVVIGKTFSNEVLTADITQMPHLLIAGTTGQGKSVALHSFIASLLFKKHPIEVKLVLIDTKKIEFNLYAPLQNHFLAKVQGFENAIISDASQAIMTLNSLAIEADNRFALFSKASVRNLKEYNDKFVKRTLKPTVGHRFLPYIVVMIDEFSDIAFSEETDKVLSHLTQKAHGAGIHIILATQRPASDIVSGQAKSNMTSRLVFRMTSASNSRMALDDIGAEQLQGKGDAMFVYDCNKWNVQCPYIDLTEIERLVAFVGHQEGCRYAYSLPGYGHMQEEEWSMGDINNLDPLFVEAARLVVQHQQGSTSLIQRRFSIGYNRSGRIMDQLEGAGIVGRVSGSSPREMLVSNMNALDEILKKYGY